MNFSKVLKYLITGIVVGAVLFFAGFGVMNMVDKPLEVVQKPAVPVVAKPDEPAASVAVIPPEIEVNSTSSAVQNGQGTSSSPIKIKPLNANSTDNTEVAAQEENKTAAFGTLTLSTVNAVNGQATPANFMIENSDNVAVALVKDTASSTLSLPAGNYKITVTQGQAKLVRFLGVKEGQKGLEVFELDVPVLAGEPATPVVTGSATPTVETSKPVVATNNDSTELASDDPKADGVDKPATEASSEVTVAAQDGGANVAMGGLRVSALTKEGNRPTNASFYIQKLNGENVENVKGVSTQQFNVPAGKYRITARKGTARVVSEVTVVANRGLHEVFHIPEVPTVAATKPKVEKKAVTKAEPKKEAKQKAPEVKAAPVVAAKQEDKASDGKKMGRLELFSKTATNNKTIKSNFYIQTPAGKLVANKTYADSIGYKLPVGKYKVTVRSSGYKDKVIELMVRDGQVRREVFKMQPKNSAAPVSRAPTPVRQAPITQAPAIQAAPVRQDRESRRGGLQVNIVSATTGQGIIADVSVHRPNGREVSRSNQSSSARFDLPPREFVVRVTHGGLVTNQKVQIRSGKLAIKTITFK